METIIAILIGGIILGSIILFFNAFNSDQQRHNALITIGVLVCFAIEHCIFLHPDKSELLYSFTHSDFVWCSSLFFISLILPIYRFVIDEDSLVNNSYYPWAFRGYNSITEIIFLFVIVPVSILFFFLVLLDSMLHLTLFSNWIFDRLLFFSFVILLGFIHSLFGTIIAGVNIAMITAHFFLDGVFGASLGTVFDFLEIIGISSSPIKWIIVLLSTGLGIHSAISFDDVQNALGF